MEAFANIHQKRLLTPTCMHPAVGYCQSFDLPKLPTVASLSDQLFHIPIATLDWLLHPRAQHYFINTIAKRGSARRPGLRFWSNPNECSRRPNATSCVKSSDGSLPSCCSRLYPRTIRSQLYAAIVGQPAVLRIDLQNFFPSIQPARVAAVFRSLGYPLPVSTALTDLCTASCDLEGLTAVQALPRARNDCD